MGIFNRKKDEDLVYDGNKIMQEPPVPVSDMPVMNQDTKKLGFLDREIHAEMKKLQKTREQLDRIQQQADTSTKRVNLLEFLREHRMKVDMVLLLEQIDKIKAISGDDSGIATLERELLRKAEEEKDRMYL